MQTSESHSTQMNGWERRPVMSGGCGSLNKFKISPETPKTFFGTFPKYLFGNLTLTLNEWLGLGVKMAGTGWARGGKMGNFNLG